MEQYVSKEYLKQLKTALVVFIPSTVGENIKPKREMAIISAYEGIYDIQITAFSIIGDIEVSHLLGINEVVVPHLIEEYAKLLFVLKTLELKLKKLNQFSEIAQALSSLNSALQAKDIGKHLYNDLENLAARSSIDIDLKLSVQSMKTYEASDGLLAQVGLK